MSEAYDRVVADLPRLTQEERSRVSDRLKMLGSAPLPVQEGDDDVVAVVAEVISEVVLRMSGERAAPAILRKMRGASSLRSKSYGLVSFLGEHARTRVHRRALLSLGFEMLYRDLLRAGFSVTSRTLMSCAHQVPAVLDRAFPGYARSGKLGMVVDASARGGEGK